MYDPYLDINNDTMKLEMAFLYTYYCRHKMSVMTAQAKKWRFEQKFFDDVSLYLYTQCDRPREKPWSDRGKYVQKYNMIIYVYLKEFGP